MSDKYSGWGPTGDPRKPAPNLPPKPEKEVVAASADDNVVPIAKPKKAPRKAAKK